MKSRQGAAAALIVFVLCLGMPLSISAQAVSNGIGSGPRLQIQRAVYGYNGKGNDVTNRIRVQIRNNRVVMQVTNDTMGGDPNKGNKKNLKIVYTYGGRQQTRMVNENAWLRLP
jgi:hypothetical protein